MAAPRPPDSLTGIDYPYQTRNWVAGPYEEALVDALEQIFGDGATTLDEIVTELNKTTVRPRGRGEWTAELFKSEMTRLAK